MAYKQGKFEAIRDLINTTPIGGVIFRLKFLLVGGEDIGAEKTNYGSDLYRRALEANGYIETNKKKQILVKKHIPRHIGIAELLKPQKHETVPVHNL